tara:strand:- start:184 stop:351 length:168 start_codon:yes stop_codon:yes gene_type:complete
MFHPPKQIWQKLKQQTQHREKKASTPKQQKTTIYQQYPSTTHLKFITIHSLADGN